MDEETKLPAEDAEGSVDTAPAAEPEPKINIDEFAKVEMTIGEILSAEIVEGADKLLRLMVEVGEAEPRQIVSGIRAWFPEPEVLVGKRVPFVTNLKPRMIKGLESNGMILAASDGDNFSLLETNGLVAAGTKLK